VVYYQWPKGTGAPVSAEAVGEEIERLPARGAGSRRRRWSRQRVPESPLHPLFSWDRAEQWREMQAPRCCVSSRRRRTRTRARRGGLCQHRGGGGLAAGVRAGAGALADEGIAPPGDAGGAFALCASGGPSMARSSSSSLRT
jgi:hypothetical protein